ncbi:MAG TPA: ABC transporter permease [Casimicrobiaceae bacterium]|nr:ABC transporter permease [Casimicrobiaceae bacterium]
MRDRSMVFAALVLAAIVAMGIAAPWLTPFDPAAIAPASRNLVTGAREAVRADDGSVREVRHWMGTDTLGRDIATRVLFGARVSLSVGIAVAALATAFGVAIGLIAGYLRRLDGPVMRIMDGLMAIPGILLALALASVWSGGVAAVIAAVVVTEIPRVVRLVRALVLALREEPYVEAAIAAGTSTPALIVRHILPGTWSPLIVQATYIGATAILVEAILSFLGVGVPPETPTWGNIMAQGRSLFRVYPHAVLWPGLFVALTVLAINILGDGLRDALDPRVRREL